MWLSCNTNILEVVKVLWIHTPDLFNLSAFATYQGQAANMKRWTKISQSLFITCWPGVKQTNCTKSTVPPVGELIAEHNKSSSHHSPVSNRFHAPLFWTLTNASQLASLIYKLQRPKTSSNETCGLLSSALGLAIILVVRIFVFSALLENNTLPLSLRQLYS